MVTRLVAMTFLFLQPAIVANAVEAQDGPLEFSCVAFPKELRQADLIARYGAENVRTAAVFGSDDGPQDGTVVFPGADDRKLEIVWWDPTTKAKPHWIRVQGAGSRWSTPNGIAVGMDLRTIERANGRPFRLAGFSTEGQGIVRSWENGRLKSADMGDCSVRISLQPDAAQNIDPWLTRQVLSGEFSSGHLAMQALNPRVVSMSVMYSSR
jgi:hypothetical protein